MTLVDARGISEPPSQLGHLAGQLWQPWLDSGEARLTPGRSRFPTSAWSVSERYRVVPSLQRATLLVPDGPRPVTRAAFANYRRLRSRTRSWQRAVLSTGLRLPFPTLSVEVPASSSRSPLPLEVLAEQLGHPRLYAAVGVRTGANRKATLQLLDPEGRPAGFAKIAWDDVSAAAVQAEVHALSSLPADAAARAPRVLAAGRIAGSPYLVLEPLPLSSRRAGERTPTAQELFALCPVTRWAPLGETEQVAELGRRLGALPALDDMLAVSHAAAMLFLTLRERDDRLPVAERWHGDLTPWNTARDATGTLWCWDWESSEPDAVAGLDAVHWHVTARTERGRRLTGETLLEAYRDALAALVAAGAAAPSRPLVAGLYAVTIAERALSLRAARGQWEQEWVTAPELLDLLETARALVEDGIR